MITNPFCHLARAFLREVVDPSLVGLRQQLTDIQTRIITMSETFDTELTALRADVLAQSTVIASATAAFNGLAAQLAAAEQKSANAGATAEQLAGFTAVRTSLEANTAALASAIPAGTPAATTTVDQNAQTGQQTEL